MNWHCLKWQMFNVSVRIQINLKLLDIDINGNFKNSGIFNNQNMYFEHIDLLTKYKYIAINSRNCKLFRLNGHFIHYISKYECVEFIAKSMRLNDVCGIQRIHLNWTNFELDEEFRLVSPEITCVYMSVYVCVVGTLDKFIEFIDSW